MGRKGVSKRKAKQSRSNSSPGTETKGSEFSVTRAVESQPAKVPGAGKAVTADKSDGKPSSDRKKNSKRG